MRTHVRRHALVLVAGFLCASCKHSVVSLGEDIRAAADSGSPDAGAPPASMSSAGEGADAGTPADALDASPADAAPPARAEPDASASSDSTSGTPPSTMEPPSSPPPPSAGAPAPPAAVSGNTAPAPRLPLSTAPCPTLQTGTVQFGGLDVQLWVGPSMPSSEAPLLLYWHGTGSASSEAMAMASEAVDDVLSHGGVIAALGETTKKGVNTSTGTWSTGDFEIADQIVACAVRQRAIDVRRIYTGGCSSGAVQAAVMAFQRSSYVASAMTNSGGLVDSFDFDDPSHVPAVIAAHGPKDKDVVVIDFSDASMQFAKEIAAHGGFAVECPHMGGHCGAPADFQAAQWAFLKAHTFGAPSPYLSGLPADFPTSCKVIR